MIINDLEHAGPQNNWIFWNVQLMYTYVYIKNATKAEYSDNDGFFKGIKYM